MTEYQNDLTTLKNLREQYLTAKDYTKGVCSKILGDNPDYKEAIENEKSCEVVFKAKEKEVIEVALKNNAPFIDIVTTLRSKDHSAFVNTLNTLWSAFYRLIMSGAITPSVLFSKNGADKPLSEIDKFVERMLTICKIYGVNTGNLGGEAVKKHESAKVSYRKLNKS